MDAVQRGDDAAADELAKAINQVPTVALGSAALWYASVGWPVLPLVPGQKRPLTSHGLKDATTDPNKIREWWTNTPEANIGIRTGVMFDAIDVDGPTGIQSLAELGDDVIPPVHGKVNTPRGIHLLVEKTGDGNRAGVRPGIDYRGRDGFVVAPPSRVDFRSYSWIAKPSPVIMKES